MPVTKNWSVGRGETLTISGRALLNGVAQDLTGWTVTWAAAIDRRSTRLWWEAGTVSGEVFTLTKVIDFNYSSLVYDILFTDPDSNSTHYCEGVINIVDRITPSGTPP